MKLRLRDEPRDWRKSGLLGALGFSILSSLLRWRHVIKPPAWFAILGVLAVVAICALLRPRLFRPWHRLTGWIAFHIGQWVGRVSLTVAFFVVITPAGLLLRLFKQDPLKMKREENAKTFWSKSKEITPLDSMF